MANPSTVPASAAGTEILRRVYKNELGSTNTKLLDGQANYTYTILTISFTEMGNNAGTKLHLWMDIEGGGTEVFLLYNQSIGAKETFVYDQKTLMAHSDELWIGCASAANVDVYCTYIEQRWA